MASNEITQRLYSLERNYTDLSHEVSRLRTLLEEKEKLRPVFLESSATKKTFGKQVESMINQVIRNESFTLDIMGFFDNNFVETFETCANRIRIIGHGEAKKSKFESSAQNHLLQAGAEIRVHELLHARMVLTPNSVIIGSVDLQADCLSGNRIDACIWSNHPEVISSSQEFFNKIWQESKPVGNTQLLFCDFEKFNLDDSPHDPWKVYRGNGQIKVTNEVLLQGKSTKCLKIVSPDRSLDFILYEFRECKKLKIEYKLRQESYNEVGIGACMHVFHTPVKVTHPVLNENEAVHMAIEKKQIYHYDTKHNFTHVIKPKTWYQIDLEIDCDTQSYTYKVNGKPYEGYFRHPHESVNAIITTPWNDQPEWTTYLDQIKLSKIE